VRRFLNLPGAVIPGLSAKSADGVTSIVDAIRDLFAQQPVGTDIWTALAWCIGILIVAHTLAMVTYRRRMV
jgi:ABC-2 type transport system permease protein